MSKKLSESEKRELSYDENIEKEFWFNREVENFPKNRSRGLLYQLEHSRVNNGIVNTKEQLEDLINKLEEFGSKQKAERSEAMESNLKHLFDRSEELGLPVPPEILIRFHMTDKVYVSHDFYMKHKKWW